MPSQRIRNGWGCVDWKKALSLYRYILKWATHFTDLLSHHDMNDNGGEQGRSLISASIW